MQELRELLSDSAKLADLAGLGEAADDALGRKACCASLYDSAPVRLLLGDTLHPGGLALTHRLGKLVDIQPDQLVLDVACGRGASAVAVARSFHCRVVGVDLGGESIAAASRLAAEGNMDGRVSFLQGDGETLPLSPGSFDAALCECSMSLFPDKAQGCAEIARLLRPGGRLGISDVTVEAGMPARGIEGHRWADAMRGGRTLRAGLPGASERRLPQAGRGAGRLGFHREAATGPGGKAGRLPLPPKPPRGLGRRL